MTKIKVNVVIAGRTYPLSVENTDEEQGMRTAAKNINDLLVKFEQKYAVADKQDVLAMCALQFASKLEIVSLANEKENTEVINKINDLANLLGKHL
ncbi:cell division protein ZapA [Tenacibaculum finnmarkense]|uniref:Cell division protein ZapA n=1 Tax=Tenacibaculum finnmarkense genomovar ulcerans TaxID=2781388 RepID=A0A2I2LDG6_9FLAO|nr:cell division protein ZapA [Tenacibaculum finnmarkense]ALU74555.1 cell division protein ZapA [Tenacibaculum dicentrarchi]MBE7634414.1 cell division protein ZapA [Tenacibaculum finnmarkense genomovar ulcerans]MBE7645574.1 cell division protein ZapA [Tenacibaculum finnmarkense genomovar ulcerans]MBE7647598.1 cell division protein ZapA [Tenacibaculum finnmarkense genomovar ulcerans]MBE7687621.1 cell division protein ZapA [Tenacibaculum finnmarkense genomovar ulcerans]